MHNKLEKSTWARNPAAKLPLGAEKGIVQLRQEKAEATLSTAIFRLA
jgi:hypothetical protein